MYAATQKHDLPSPWLFRYCGRAGGLIIVIGWLVFVAIEFFHSGAPVIANYYQAAFLAVVFIGYASGWHDEILGGLLTIAGTAGFVALNLTLFGVLLSSGEAWFAAPGVFYLIAHYLDYLGAKQESSLS